MTTSSDAVVFIIDDDDAVRDALSLLIEAEGLMARTYASADEFVAALEPSQHGCVIADVRMPGMNGIELLQYLQTRNILIPVIIVTGHGDLPMAVAALRGGAADFFEKPFDDKLLLASLQESLDRDQTLHRREIEVAELRSRLANLTPREREIMSLIIEGHPNKTVANRLAISPRTVEVHRSRVMEKMQARNLSDLVRMSLRLDEMGGGI